MPQQSLYIYQLQVDNKQVSLILQSLHYQLSKAQLTFGDKVSDFKITVLPQATFLVSTGNNMVVVCNFICFAANDVKGRKVATGYGASCL